MQNKVNQRQFLQKIKKMKFSVFSSTQKKDFLDQAKLAWNKKISTSAEPNPKERPVKKNLGFIWLDWIKTNTAWFKANLYCKPRIKILTSRNSAWFWHILFLTKYLRCSFGRQSCAWLSPDFFLEYLGIGKAFLIQEYFLGLRKNAIGLFSYGAQSSTRVKKSVGGRPDSNPCPVGPSQRLSPLSYRFDDGARQSSALLVVAAGLCPNHPNQVGRERRSRHLSW